MTTCDTCKIETDSPVSVVIGFGGGKEFRAMVCGRCGEAIQKYVEEVVYAEKEAKECKKQ